MCLRAHLHMLVRASLRVWMPAWVLVWLLVWVLVRQKGWERQRVGETEMGKREREGGQEGKGPASAGQVRQRRCQKQPSER